METQTASTKKIGLNYGLIMGLVLTLLTVIFYVVDISLFTSLWILLLNFLIILAFGIIAAASTKKLMDGFPSFKQVFTTYTITMAVGLLISTLIMIVLFNFIDPEAAETVKDLSIEQSVEFMERFGAPESEIQKQIAVIQEQDTYGIGTQLKNYVFFLAFMLVIGLLVSLIFRKKDPNKA